MKFLVSVEVRQSYDIEVEANTAGEAKEEASKADRSQLEPYDIRVEPYYAINMDET